MTLKYIEIVQSRNGIRIVILCFLVSSSIGFRTAFVDMLGGL